MSDGTNDEEPCGNEVDLENEGLVNFRRTYILIHSSIWSMVIVIGNILMSRIRMFPREDALRCLRKSGN
jgi:hypothetical protein